ncbi:ribonuclease R [Marinilongibacter aquaticus]|uniref:ribonuclease R n=1 Tax=Marinilongibacter aquaticus TaxID=2975157 RepID=UPI0021BDBDC7|nr:ribonuclease R [Marinilongibacter aquaticus]UBM57388.1 ribonuclease R [Marinilongibacter aquaticus]
MARKKKSDLQRTKEEILSLLKNKTERPVTLSDLLNAFSVYDKDDNVFFRLILEELLDEGKIQTAGRGKYQLASKGNQSEIVGVFDHVNPSFGFVRYDEGQKDIYISESMLNGALDGDKVRVRLLGKTRSKGENPEGRVVEILERGKKEWVAKVKVYANYAIAKPENRRFHEDIFIAKNNMLEAKTNDLVLIEILNFPSDHQQATGRVVEVLGQSGDNDAEMHAIMADFGLPVKFPENVEKLAKAIPEEIEPSEITKRRDERPILTFTIDPADAKDFDDALSFQVLDDNVFEVGVHIADVTHYVRPGTVLEDEAFKRATSVYLVDRTIPMLPEKLSNNLCSLRPNEDKLTFSAIFQLDLNGRILNEWFGRCIIHSDKRFAYEEAQEVLELAPEDSLPVGVTPEIQNALLVLNKIAKNLKADRFANGAFNFETAEVKFHLDENGKPLGVYQKVRKDAHKLIEEFMLLANKRVAEFVFNSKFSKTKKPKEGESPTMVYRVHEPPNPEKLNTFSAFVGKMGYKLNVSSQNALSQSLNSLMHEIEGSPVQNALESLAVRTMSKAKYSTEPAGHFGLAFAHYSHFTSPIRRYPDMMAHRMLQHYLDQGKSLNKEDYEEKCMHSSQQEKLAAEAERASIKYKQVEYMSFQDRRTVYEGIVTGVTDFGIFVEMQDTGCEGMVRLADMQDDYYDYDADNYRLIGQRNGRIIGFGQAVKVSVKGTDLENRSIDLNLVEVAGQTILGNTREKSRGGSSRPSTKNRRTKSRKVIPPKKGKRRGRR